jgi:hypothetical protein
MRLRLALFGLSALMLPAAAGAQDLAVRGACAGDYERLCFSIPPTDPRAVSCLSSQFGQLTAECRHQLGGAVGQLQSDTGTGGGLLAPGGPPKAGGRLPPP